MKVLFEEGNVRRHISLLFLFVLMSLVMFFTGCSSTPEAEPETVAPVTEPSASAVVTPVESVVNEEEAAQAALLAAETAKLMAELTAARELAVVAGADSLFPEEFAKFSAEYDALIAARGEYEDDYMKIAYSYNLQHEISKIVQNHTHIGFVSGGHTGEDLFLAVYNPNGQQPSGHLEASELCEYMCRLSGLPMSLDELTSNIYARHDVLLAGHSCEIEGGKNDAVLTVDGGVLRIPANRSFVLKDGKKIPLKSVSVYVPENGYFYISREILDMLRN